MSKFVSVIDFDCTLTERHTWQTYGAGYDVAVAPRSTQQAVETFGGRERLERVSAMLHHLRELGDILILTRSDEADVQLWFELARTAVPHFLEPTRIVGRTVLGTQAEAKARVVETLLGNGAAVGYVDDSPGEIDAVQRRLAQQRSNLRHWLRVYTSPSFAPVASGGTGGLTAEHMDEIVRIFAAHATLAARCGL